MMQNLHTHTNLCDGKNTAEEMLLTAMAKGFDSLGFSGHSPLPFDNGYCMNGDSLTQYYAEIARLRQVYGDQIQIHLGLEEEYLFPTDTSKLDYFISSVHIIRKDGRNLDVDNRRAILSKNVADYYDGNIFEYIQDYYDLVVKASKRGDILGHFDLITKFNEQRDLFDERQDPYRKIAFEAMDACLESGIIIEINSGAIQRGYRTSFYPDIQFLDLMREKNGRILISSDAHSVEAIGFYYQETVEILKAHGFQTHWVFTGKEFTEIPL